MDEESVPHRMDPCSCVEGENVADPILSSECITDIDFFSLQGTFMENFKLTELL